MALGVQTSFVSDAQGYPSYGTVTRIRSYENDGSAAEIYFPYSAVYGGSSMRYRMGLYDNAGWSSWKTVLDSENYNSYAPTLTGGGASGTWGISVSGNASTATSTALLRCPDGDRSADTKLPTSTPQGVRFDFVSAGSVSGAAGNYAGLMTYAPWTGDSAGNGDSSYQVAFTNQSGVNASGPAQLLLRNGINSTWNSWQTVLSSSNYNSYSPTLTGGGASGTWGINITGNAGSAYGLGVHGGRNNEANKVVRTDGNGYLHVGYVNSSNGNENNASSPPRVWGTNGTDDYMRTYQTSSLVSGYATYIQTQYPGTANVGYGASTTLRTDNGSGVAFNYAPVLHVAASDTMWQMQVNHGTGNGTMAFRQGYGGSWGSWLTVLSSANYTEYACTRRPEGANYIDYSRYVYDNAAYDGSARWCEPSDLGVRYARYGRLVYNNGAYSGSGWVEPSDLGVRYASRASRSYDNFYLDANYGNTIVGAYASTRYQGVYAMGDDYKLPADGTSAGNLYGLAWSYPSAGGVAGNLDSHGLLVLINGGLGCALSNSIVASGNVTAYSDERLKTNWRPMPEDYVSRLAKVKVGIYDRLDAAASNKAAAEASETDEPVVPIPVTQVGVGAQSLREVLPEAITEAKDEMGTLSVSYGNAALASCVELAKELVALRAELAELKLQLKGA